MQIEINEWLNVLSIESIVINSHVALSLLHHSINRNILQRDHTESLKIWKK